MKRLNVKLLIIVAVTVVVLTLGVVSVHAIQSSRNVGNLLELAKESEQAGDLGRSVSFYSRYLQYRPDDTEQQANYALACLKFSESPDATMRDTQLAYNALRDAVQNLQTNDPGKKLDAVREKLVDFQMRYGALVAAKDHLLKMKAANTAAKKDDPIVDLRLAKCQIRTAFYMEALKLLEPLVGYDRATKTFDDAKATAPKEIEAYALMALLLRERLSNSDVPDRLALADQVIEQLAKVNPDNPKAILAQAQDILPRSIEKGKPLVERALKVAPNDADAILMASQLAMNEKELDKAEKLLKHGVKENPTDSRLYRHLLNIVMVQNRSDEAETIIRDGLTKLPNNPDLLESRFLLQIYKGDFVGARHTLDVFDSIQVSPILRELLECRLLIQRKNYSDAKKRLVALRPKIAGNKQFEEQIDTMLVQLAFALGEPDIAEHYSKNLKVDYVQTLINKAQAALGQGKSSEALEVFEEIANRLPPEKLAKMQNVWRPLYELRVGEQLRLPKVSRNWQSIESLLKILREQQGLGEPNLSLIDVDFLIRKGEIDQAQQMLDALAKQYPGDSSLLAATARFVAQQKGDSEKALEMLNSVGAELQNDPVIVSTRIECIASSKGKPEEKIRQLSKLGESAADWPEAHKFQAYSSLGIAMVQLQDIDEAQRWFGKAAEVHPEDSRLRWMLFDLARSSGDQSAMKELAKWFSQNRGADDAQTKMIEAVQLVSAVRVGVQSKIAPNQNEISLDAGERATLKKASALLNEIKNQRPGWHEIPKLFAEINIFEGQLDEAAANLKEALALGPANGRMIQQLVHLLYAKNHYQEAKEILDTYKSLVGKDLERLGGEIDKHLGIKATFTDEQIEKLVDKDSKNISDQMYRATLLVNAGKSDEAEAVYRKIVSLNPDLPQVWLALIDHLVKQKKGIEAHEAVQAAQIQLPEDQRALALAQAYELLNDIGQADQFYLSALETAPDETSIQRAVAAHYLRTNRAARARPYLDKIVNNPPAATDQNDNYAWARRESAKLLAAQPDYQQFLKAMDMLKPTKGITPDPQDLALKAALLAERGEPASARQALQLLTTLGQQRPLVTLERLLLAQVQERLDNWSAANSEMLSLVAQSKAPPMIYVAYIEMLLRNDNATEAGRWLQTLKGMAPDTPEISILTARIDAAMGRGARAATNLKKELPTKRPLPKEQWRQLLAIAGLLEQLKQYDEAEKLLREYLSYAPQDALMLAKFLADRGKVDDTIALVEQLRNNFSASPLLQVLLVAMRQKVAPPTQQQIDKVEAFFARALRDDPESSLVQIQLAGLREFQGQNADPGKSQGYFVEAEKLYRQVFLRAETRPIDRAIVANNLAYLLAIQGKQLDDALKFIKTSMDFMGPQSDILDTRGLIYLAQGKAKEAVVDLKDATMSSADPNRATKLVHLAIAQAAAKDEAGAKTSLRRAAELKFDPATLPPIERTKYDATLKQLGQQT